MTPTHDAPLHARLRFTATAGLLVGSLLCVGACAATRPRPGQERVDAAARNEAGLALYAAGDLQGARREWAAACEGGLAEACHWTGIAIDELATGDPAGEAEAAAWFRRACNGGEGRGCGMVGLKYQYGRGLPRDDRKAQHFYTLGCDLGEAKLSCQNLAVMGLSDDSSVHDKREAKALLERACGAGSGGACHSVQILSTQLGGSALEASMWLERGCSADDGPSCSALADAVEADAPERAATLRARACALGETADCPGEPTP